MSRPTSTGDDCRVITAMRGRATAVTAVPVLLTAPAVKKRQKRWLGLSSPTSRFIF